MNTATSYSSISTEHSLLRGGSARYIVLATESPLHSDSDGESVLSVQAKETDYVQDTSDTESYGSERGLEYSPEESGPDQPHSPRACALAPQDTDSESSIICTRVISVRAAEDTELEADGEGGGAVDEGGSDAELGPHDYWQCALCLAHNNNPLYRYCERCFQVRKNLFPPRPQRRVRSRALREQSASPARATSSASFPPSALPLPALLDSGIESTSNSQELKVQSCPTGAILAGVKRSLERHATIAKRSRSGDDSASSGAESESESASGRVALPSRTASAPGGGLLGSLRRTVQQEGLCVVCCAEPKSGVFVHGRVAHICCCYRCAVRVWTGTRRCPVCNAKVSNVLRAVVS